ncbi:hypothetical protein SAMN05660772_02835 [Pasteurella testudinis DSM 23072]|uniref:Uncharacterized protein n=1 Tax=Pasteurella testudinis DSM 23072 TaxID=1122938 RepID=A0A1W1V5Y4_9PAST|nr:hypothetical protein [Pasteurella testudinis]SMB88590.1 hypothetical protein SAMN05660772_02835 [Pasteurella testudinis DSM 23072]SUB50427.1 Uncharacterised protein [Pasteurella testudinis]
MNEIEITLDDVQLIPTLDIINNLLKVGELIQVNSNLKCGLDMPLNLSNIVESDQNGMVSFVFKNVLFLNIFFSELSFHLLKYSAGNEVNIYLDKRELNEIDICKMKKV